MSQTGEPTFRDPTLVWREANTSMSTLPNELLFNDSRYRPLREAWCAGVFGMGYSLGTGRACNVAVNSKDDDADFFLKVSNEVFPFQTVEAQEPTRRRGNEHKDFAAGRIEKIDYDPELGTAEGARWIADKVAEKAAKKYARAAQLSLLVYANFNGRNIQYDELLHRTADHQADFFAIWVITQWHICSLYSREPLGAILGWLEIPAMRNG